MNTLPLLLERLSTLINQTVRDDAARHGLLPIHLLVLGYLGRANRYSDLPIAIAEYFGLTRGTVSQTIAVLERRGLLTKAADARHGRRVHLQLTPQATQLMQDTWMQRLDETLQTGPTGASAAEQTLRGVLTQLQRLNQQRPFGVCQHCAHFQVGGTTSAHCGLTGEPLIDDQPERICREWSAPVTMKTPASAQ
ncbi:MAG: MarR family transcriptional regulator [Burkholderiales bacterium]|nr:MarR family transcriptional regulator [Burkholderiales bacterium]